MEKTTQYKGIFYKNKTSHKFYEGGAHFSYHALAKILNKIKDDLNKDREAPDLMPQKEEKEVKESIERIEIKKINIPLLSRQKNKSMNNLLNKNKDEKQKNQTIYTKISEELQRINNNKIRIISKEKNLENSNSVKRINKIDKYFNNSIYNNKNSLNIPLIIYNQKNKNEAKVDINNTLRKNVLLEPIKKKYNNIKMSSTIGFNENNKYYNYYMNYYKDSVLNNKASRNKKVFTNGISQSLNKYNNTHLIDKFNLINNYNQNKNFINFQKNMKSNNANSIDYNINNNYIKMNKNKLSNTKINFNNKKGKNGRIIINADKVKERMNVSIINFTNIKNSNKF